jgi:hypothetical protein
LCVVYRCSIVRYIQVFNCALYTGVQLCVIYRCSIVRYIHVFNCALYTGVQLCVIYRCSIFSPFLCKFPKYDLKI